MSQLSDVEVLYKLMGASHIPYREIKLEESKAFLSTPSLSENEIGLSEAEILLFTMSERTEPLLADNSRIIHNLIETPNLSVDSTNLIEATQPAAESGETSSRIVGANEVAVHMNNSPAEISSNAILTVQTADQSNAHLMPSNQYANTEISSLMLRIKNSSNLDKKLSKQSFFERLQC
jgi:hypothetical protein